MNDGKVIIGTELDTKGFDKEIALLERKLDDIQQTLVMSDEDKSLFSKQEVMEMEAEAQKLGRQLDKLKQKQSEIDNGGFIEMKKALENVGNEMQKTIKKVSGWAIALFGVRSAYSMIRSAMSTITANDSQLQADIEYMKNALAYVLEPIIRKIVELAKRLMFYIQSIYYMLTGKNIFANANQSLQNATSNAQALNKELKKSVASFDEMNIIPDTSSGGGGGVGGGTMPSFDLTELQEVNSISKGLIATILGIGSAIGALKLSELLKKLGLISDKLSLTKATGIGFIVAGLYLLIVDLIDIWNKFDETLDDNGTTLKDWGKIVRDVSLIVIGLGLAIGSLPVALIGALILMEGYLMQKWEEIKAWINENVIKWIDRQIALQKDNFIGGFWKFILVETKKNIQSLISITGGMYTGIKQILDGITGLFKGNSGSWKSIFKGFVNIAISYVNGFIESINGMLVSFKSVVYFAGKLLGKNWDMGNFRIPHIPYLAQGGIVNNPGKGVMMGSYIAGERGPEAVIPLDDMTLDRLGEAFARHTTINATLINTMNGRVISRALEQVKAENDFAYNG